MKKTTRSKKQSTPPLLKPFLYNETRKAVLAKEGKVYTGFMTGIGAMFTGLPGSLVLVWWRTARVAITNLFVFEDIDILWVGKDWYVVDQHHCFKAWSFSTTSKQPGKYIIELPAGTIKKTGTRNGDRITCRDLPKTS